AVRGGQGGHQRRRRGRGARSRRGDEAGSELAGLPPGGDQTARLTVTHADELARVVRDHAGRLAAALVNLTGDFATAEDLVQDAVEAALVHWPREGIPDR